jgi:hypothetical protein
MIILFTPRRRNEIPQGNRNEWQIEKAAPANQFPWKPQVVIL